MMPPTMRAPPLGVGAAAGMKTVFLPAFLVTVVFFTAGAAALVRTKGLWAATLGAAASASLSSSSSSSHSHWMTADAYENVYVR